MLVCVCACTHTADFCTHAYAHTHLGKLWCLDKVHVDEDMGGVQSSGGTQRKDLGAFG
jgi:hypothetical protein